MGLLKFESEPEFGKLAEYVSACQPCGALEAEVYCAPEKRLFREYTGFTVDFLYASVQLDDKKIFEDYVLWFYELLCPVMADMPKHRVRALLLSHFSVVENGAEQIFAGAGLKKLKRFIRYGKRAAADAEVTEKSPEPLRYGKYEKERQRYLDALMRSDTKSAVAVAAEFLQTGIPVEDILVEILGETMRGVGELWHSHQISVDMEHYCTSTTQLASAQLYPVIFRQRRKKKKVLAACVGSELHEMGARMTADLFEYNGWDSIYLGAGADISYVLKQIQDHRPDLAAFSVTMPQYLVQCQEMVDRLKACYPDLKIAVGGNAFQSLSKIQGNWRIDVYARDARELVRWADDTFADEI